MAVANGSKIPLLTDGILSLYQNPIHEFKNLKDHSLQNNGI